MCDSSLESLKSCRNTGVYYSRASPESRGIGSIFICLTAEKNAAEPFLKEASNTLNIRKSFPYRASSKLNRRGLFARSFSLPPSRPRAHRPPPPPPHPPCRAFNRALISLYKWKLNHCIPGWKMIGNESMSEVKT